MTAGEKAKGRRQRAILYNVVALLSVLLAIAAVTTWRAGKADREAEDKADRLSAALAELGAPVPERDRIVRLLGNDGGPVCADPASALHRAASLGQLSNGAGGPGTRPVIADSRILEGELAIVTIYCPDQLAEFEEFVDDLRTADLTPE
ncbi:hypothetical protein [Amycolatopsis magusensis]|uniref:hypothetical protein n=1 Tax=Amycolatopsis magusensis TaxID=882444 RepID=UPI003C2C3398